MWASAQVSIGDSCWKILNFIRAPIKTKPSVKNVNAQTNCFEGQQAGFLCSSGRGDTVQFWQLCEVQTCIKTISAGDMFYTAHKVFNGRKAFSYAAAYRLVKACCPLHGIGVFNNTFSSSIWVPRMLLCYVTQLLPCCTMNFLLQSSVDLET